MKESYQSFGEKIAEEGLVSKELEKKDQETRKRLRPNTLVEYHMVVDENNKLRKVETRKPELRDKKKKEVVDPLT
jgi:hypothetical protein